MGEELAGLLRSWRARLEPADVGLPAGRRRRVPGLRREEVAALAGLPLGQYTRLERGQRPRLAPGAAVRLARALHLGADERLRLLALVEAAPQGGPPDAGTRLRPELATLVTAIDGAAATVLDTGLNVLAWNRAGHALLAGHLDPSVSPSPGAHRPRHNLAVQLFLDPQTRRLYPEWDVEARRAVALLRHAVAREPDDSRLAVLVGELTGASRQFAALWARPPHTPGSYGKVRIRHPLVGLLPLVFAWTEFADRTGNRLLLHHAEPSAAARATFRMLTELSGPVQGPIDTP
ncbi:XRE family transcriptional regulator [Streptomyces triticagri]|uniref:XRE family transcriptional regulator n=1 Tax=Streptomyces triticagri TaxID=2293568 RepID=A0A372LWA4_9ACTN|nr:helix-turn-helix transcriptional regulator [Streptomyces triticagri]RFU82931.1 XRE family transcriptional regulator [Streptomyces triticagri]